MARDININGVNYSINKIGNVFEQTFLMTRFAPILAGAMGGDIGGIFEKIGTLDKSTVKEIYFTLLENVKRKNDSGTWSPIVNKDTNTFMFADISMMDAFTLCKESLSENFGNFFQESGLIPTAKTPKN